MERAILAGTAALALVVGALTMAPAERAGAQYPTPAGNVQLAVDDASAAPGESVDVTATLVDENGDAVEGASCTFALVEQPGSDATADAGPFITDGAGHVSTTVHAGSAAGNIVVRATCVRPDCPGGGASCELTAQATIAVAAQAEEAAEPPASLPDTGAGGGDGSGRAAWALLAIAGAALTAGGAAALRLRRAHGR